MRILFLDTYPIRRGAQVFVSELSEELNAMGHQVKKVYLYKTEPNAVMVNLLENDVVLGGNPSHFFEKIPSFHPKLVKKFIREVKEFSPDVILFNGSRTLKYAAIAKLFLGTKIKWITRVIDNAEYWNTGFLTKIYYKYWVIPTFDASVGVSLASRNSMVRHYDFKKPTRVIHRAFNMDKFQTSLTKEGARKLLKLDNYDEVLLFLGNITAQKRPDKFLAIVQELKKTRPNIKALVVGNGVDLPKYVDVMKQNETYILHMGYQKEVAPYLAAADLLLLPSDTEGLPGVVLEAGYFGVPTISTDVGGIRECLIDDETGCIVPDKSIDGFVAKIHYLLDNPQKRIEMGQKSKKLVIENFNLKTITNSYIDFFETINNSK
jgi:glycosyltransferase involved in cell wall biosynthesis